MINSVDTLPDFNLDGLTALVTGGGSGLGRELSHALAAQGARLILVGRTASSLEETATALGSGHQTIAVDLLSDEAFHELASSCRDVDILVNNAGGDIRKSAWLNQTPDDWRLTLELNVLAPARLAQLVAPGMISRNWGRIINVSSVYGFLGQDPRNTQAGLDSAAYIAGKHGILGLTRFLAGRLGAHGITSNAISPGMFPLALDDPALLEKPWKRCSPELLDHLAEGAPVGRVGRNGDLGAAVIFLASRSSAFVTGQNLAVDGGWSVW